LPDGSSAKGNDVSEEGIAMTQDALPITVSDWMAAQARTKRLGWFLGLGAAAVAIGLCMVGVVIADAVATGAARWPLAGGLMLLLLLPLTVGSVLAGRRQQDKTDGLVGRLTQQLA
jgi:hypothetical protein